MRKFRKVIITIVVLYGAYWIINNWRDLNAFPSIISSWYSKELCSCIFVLEQDEPFCHSVVKQWLPVGGFSIDRNAKTTTAWGLGRTNSARYTGSRTGCTLVN